MSWYVDFVEKHSFWRISVKSPRTLWRLSFSTKFPQQEIRWNYGILRSENIHFRIISEFFPFSKCPQPLPLPLFLPCSHFIWIIPNPFEGKSDRLTFYIFFLLTNIFWEWTFVVSLFWPQFFTPELFVIVVISKVEPT